MTWASVAAAQILGFLLGVSILGVSSPTRRVEVAPSVWLGPNATGIERAAAEEIRDYLAESTGLRVELISSRKLGDRTVIVGTPESSPFVERLSAELKLSSLGDEGFVVQPHRDGRSTAALIGANRPRGVLYGAFAAVERAMLEEDIWTMRLRSSPALTVRNVWAWSRPSSSQDAFFSFDAMREPDKHGHFRELGRQLARMRPSIRLPSGARSTSLSRRTAAADAPLRRIAASRSSCMLATASRATPSFSTKPKMSSSRLSRAGRFARTTSVCSGIGRS